VQALEAAGHVDVTADLDDGRSCFVSLTAAGREEITRLTQIGLARFASFVADWDAEEVRALARLLTKLVASQAKVNRREPRPVGRRWQQKERS
jgi:DNA-binding MarR family transcriptional regulator